MSSVEQYPCRDGEPSRWQGRRRERFFLEADGWYFRARGNRLVGPFESRYEAQQELLMYVRKQRLRGILPGEHLSAYLLRGE